MPTVTQTGWAIKYHCPYTGEPRYDHCNDFDELMDQLNAMRQRGVAVLDVEREPDLESMYESWRAEGHEVETDEGIFG